MRKNFTTRYELAVSKRRDLITFNLFFRNLRFVYPMLSSNQNSTNIAPNKRRFAAIARLVERLLKNGFIS